MNTRVRVQSCDLGEARTQCSAPHVTAARGPSSPAGVHDHHKFVPLGAVPDGQLDLPQRRLAQGRPTGEAKQKVNALLRTEGRPTLAREGTTLPVDGTKSELWTLNQPDELTIQVRVPRNLACSVRMHGKNETLRLCDSPNDRRLLKAPHALRAPSGRLSDRRGPLGFLTQG